MTELDLAITPEFDRVRFLSQRQWALDDLERLAALLTERLKTPEGTMSLLLPQAQILAEVKRIGGGFTSAPVGFGKTLVTAVAPTLLGARHPLLIVPSSTKPKTFRDFAELRKHWQIPQVYPVLTYELLQHPNHRETLLQRDHDLIVCDEIDYLNTNGDVIGPRTRRILEYKQKNPHVRFVGLTGTPMSRALVDFFAHLSLCLGEYSPLPRNRWEVEQWDQALGLKTTAKVYSAPLRRDPAPLLELGDGTEQGTLTERATQCVQKRLERSWGFVNVPGMSCDKEINLRFVEDVAIPQTIADALADAEGGGETLNGDILETGLEVSAYVRQLLCGFFHLWDPAPPEAWLKARRKWRGFVREELKFGGYNDSPSLVEQEYVDHPYRQAWREIEPTFDPDKNRKVAWISTYLVDDVLRRFESSGATIYWVEFRELGKALAKALRAPYYGGGNAASRAILDEKGDRSIVASIPAHHVAKNLQMFRRNVVLNLPTIGRKWEQLVGRTHRQGQRHDVDLTVYRYHSQLRDDWRAAESSARDTENILRQPQKIIWAQRKRN